MEREDHKRGREENKETIFKESKKRNDLLNVFEEGGDILNFSSSHEQPGLGLGLGVFEFPWEKENLVSGLSECETSGNNDEIFNLSLAEGCLLEFLGERFWVAPPQSVHFPAEKGRDESQPSDAKQMDGGDCIWSCILNQPLSIGLREFATL